MTTLFSTIDNLVSRRKFLRIGATATVGAFAPGLGIWSQPPEEDHSQGSAFPNYGGESRGLMADQGLVESLVQRAVDAASAAGATYAEARVTRTVTQTFLFSGLLMDQESLEIGVRALVNGAWGFAASPYWEMEEASQLAQDAVAQAIANAGIGPREVDMGSYPVAKGSWSTPIRIDPFLIPLEEKIDFVKSFAGLLPRHVRGRKASGGMANMGFIRQERTIASTEGALFHQTLYQSGGDFRVNLEGREADNPQPDRQTVFATGINMAGAGWELMLDARLREQIPHLLEEAESLLFVPRKPVEIGRYNLVCDAVTMANLVDGTLGRATQLDRVLGYEANATGTSYLGPDPFTFLGTTLGESGFSVSGNRSMSKGLATVKWDDEGVEPEDFQIVSNGTLVDYQTTREQASWLSQWYKKHQREIRSHGCAASSSARLIPLQHTPNLVMSPGKEDVSFDDLISDIERGIAVSAQVAMDFQSRSGTGSGAMREIVNGKLGAFIDGASFLFDSAQLWKTLEAIGGHKSADVIPSSSLKGEPAQRVSYSVSAVPGVFKDMAIIDARRKV